MKTILNSLCCRVITAFFVLSFTSVAHANFSWSGGGEGDWTAAGNWSGSFTPSTPAYWIAAAPEDSFPGQSAANLLADPNDYVSFQLSDFGPNPHSESYSDLAEYQTAYNAHFGSLPNPAIYSASSFGPNPNDAVYTTLAEYRTAFPEATYNSNYTSAQSSVVTNISNIIIPAVTFASAGSTTVNFNSNIKVSGISFNPDSEGVHRSVQFNLSGSTLTGNFNQNELGHQTLIFDSGVYDITNTFRIGSGNVARETLIRLQNGVLVNLTSAEQYLGDSGTFAMEVVGGSELINPLRMQIGRGSGTVASLTISGVGSNVENHQSNAGGNNFIGSVSGTGTLTVEDGGRFLGGRRIYVGSGATGSLIVRGSGINDLDEVVYSTVTTTGNANGLFIRGTESGSATSGSGYALFQDGGRGLFTHSLAVWNGGTLEIDRGFVSVSAGTHGGSARIFDAGSELIYWLYSGEYDPRITVAGSFEINNGGLTIKLGDGFSADLGEEFFLIQRPTNYTGIFDGLTEGSTLSVDGYTFEIGYAMGDSNNMIGLTVIPEPRIAAAMAAAVAGLVVLLRRRRRNGVA